jgi:hypothetical protein
MHDACSILDGDDGIGGRRLTEGGLRGGGGDTRYG